MRSAEFLREQVHQLLRIGDADRGVVALLRHHAVAVAGVRDVDRAAPGEALREIAPRCGVVIVHAEAGVTPHREEHAVGEAQRGVEHIVHLEARAPRWRNQFLMIKVRVERDQIFLRRGVG